MLKVKYIDTAPDAAEDAVPSMPDKKPYSNPKDAILGKPVRRGQSCELNRIGLNGTWPMNPANMSSATWGIESLSLCGADCRFSSPPVLDITFINQHSAVGLTFIFDDNWCQELDVTWYRGGAILLSNTYYPNAETYFCDGRVELFNRITITFKEMSFPFTFLRVNQLLFGMVRVFGPDEISRANIFMASSLLSEEMQIDTFNLGVRSQTSIAFMFQRKQRVEVEHNDRPLGVYYIATSTQEAADAWSVAAEGVLGLLDVSNHMGGIYTGQAAATVIASIMGPYAYTLDASLQSIPVYGWLPIGSRRENLQRALFAIGAVEVAGSDGVLNIKPPTYEITSEVPVDRAYLGGSIATKDIVTAVEVTEYTYTATTDTDTLYQGAAIGGVTVVFNEPRHTLSITGGTITESGANYAKITGSNVTLTGGRYSTFTRTVRVENPDVASADLEKIVTADCTLVSSRNSQAVANRLMSYYRRRNSVRTDIVWDGESPGDMITIPTLFSGLKAGHIASMDLMMSGIVKAEIEAIEL